MLMKRAGEILGGEDRIDPTLFESCGDSLIVNLGTEELSIKDLWIYFTPMPHWPDNALQDYTGWFHSNDEKLNRYGDIYSSGVTHRLIEDSTAFGMQVLVLHVFYTA